jgi:hypothetical protein
MVQLLSSPDAAVVTPCLRLFGNIVSGNDKQTDRAIKCGLLPHYRQLLFHEKKSVRKEACWGLSNITAGTPLQVAAVIACDIIAPVVKIIEAIRAQNFS